MARIRRFHRRGRGSIPRKGVFVLNVFPIYFYVQNRFHFPQSLTNSADWRLKLTIIKHASSRIIITINTNKFHRCYIITVRCQQEVRMAERSKAPDSRVRLFPSQEYSGPRMWAWVRIPLLTNVFRKRNQVNDSQLIALHNCAIVMHLLSV